MDKFQNKYRIPSARLQNWDYGSNGAYFITICTKNREHYFGEIIDAPPVETPNLGVSTMQLSEMGQLAEKYWLEIPTHFPFIELGNFVVMPNHTHGILIIDKWNAPSVAYVPPVASVPPVLSVETPKLGVSTTTTKNGGKNDKWKPETIGVIINQYKRMVTINARKIHIDFNWQSRFHDHIIRNADSFETIQNYITNNPSNWNNDKFYN